MTREVVEKLRTAFSDDRILGKMIGYAQKVVQLLGEAGLAADAARIEDLVYDVITKTLDGTLTWEPKKVPLTTHLCGAVKARVFHELRHAEAFREVTLDELDESPSGSLFFSASPEWQMEIAERLQRVRGHLLELCNEKQDDQVRKLLLAYADGIAVRTELSIETGMSVDEVTNAGKRLDRMIAALPSELRPESWEGRKRNR